MKEARELKKFIALSMIAASLLFLGFAGGYLLGEDRGGLVPSVPTQSIPEGTLAREPVDESVSAEFRVNLNTATAEELQKIPGIGPTIAERILAYRTKQGGFRTVSELLAVSGIGEKSLERLEPYLYIES